MHSSRYVDVIMHVCTLQTIIKFMQAYMHAHYQWRMQDFLKGGSVILLRQKLRSRPFSIILREAACPTSPLVAQYSKMCII